MGQHTWFHSSLADYEEMRRTYDAAQDAEDHDEYSSAELYNEIADELHDKISTEYHDCFRTTERQDDNSYIDEVIKSREDCIKWLEDNKEFVYDLDMEKVEAFWKQYPNGCIRFG